MKVPASASWKAPLKFRMLTAENLVPIRLDIEVDGQRYKDAFTWNPYDPDSEVVMFAKRTVKDLKLAPGFIPQIVQSIQSQLADFRSYEGQDMYAGDKIVPIKLDLRVHHTVIRDQFLWDLNNFESDPEEFARTLCKDLGIEDPEVGPAIAFAIREQLYEIAIQNVTSARENRINKKGRRGAEHFPPSKASGAALDLMKLFSFRSSVVRKRKEWDYYKPILDLLSNEDVDALEAKEERSGRLTLLRSRESGWGGISSFLTGSLAYKMKNLGSLGSSERLSMEENIEDEEISRLAISTFQTREEEIERKKMEVKEKVELQLGRAEEETRRLSTIWEELEVLSDPLRKEVAMVRKKIDMANRELKPLGQSCQKKEKEYKEALEAFNEKNKEKAQLVTTLMEMLTESEKLRMKKLEELNKNIESIQ